MVFTENNSENGETVSTLGMSDVVDRPLSSGYDHGILKKEGESPGSK